MSKEDEKIIPKCMQMCPAVECSFRIKQNLIHTLETDGTKQKRLENTNKMIKTYCRSAAGQDLTKSELLRPPSVLKKTVNYILKEIINDKRVSKSSKYDFINDRLRSVKQDGVIQRLSPKDWFEILPPVIRFYAFSAYWLIEESSNNFDQKLNQNQLRDCLLQFISNYDIAYLEYAEVYAEMESLYLILNPDVETMNRAVLLDLPQDVFQNTLSLMLRWYDQNYLSVFRKIITLPVLPACLFTAIYLSKLRKNYLQIMAFAYNCKNSSYPISKLKVNLLFNSEEEAAAECSFYDVTVENNVIQFKKFPFKREIAPCKKLKILDKKLCNISISNLLIKT